MKRPCLFLFFLFITLNVNASIVLKIVGANPSESEEKTVELKAWLPEEVTPEHIINNDGMQVLYDDQKGSYYVYENVEVLPGERTEREVEIEDIWTFDKDTLDKRRADMDAVLPLLRNSAFGQRVEYMRGSIEAKLKLIEDTLEGEVVNPGQHIFRYRNNMTVLTQIDSELSVAREMMLSVKRIPSVNIWRLIIILVSLIAVIAGVLYYVWSGKLDVTDLYKENK